jgi:D-arabinan exo alpha-(1,3)/(1,5)-arabinofuranosidase (non-reducing end)
MWRRDFVHSVVGAAGMAGMAGVGRVAAEPAQPGGTDWVPAYARRQSYRSRKQSSHDTTGGNADAWPIAAGAEKEIFRATGAGAITHVWFTIAADALHLKELVLRGYWDGLDRPSIETPIGDFFGLNLGDYVIYQSQYLACSPGQSLNCYFAMPYRKGARLTVTNESSRDVGAFYSNIDYVEADAIPDDALYFHAQYRQAVPNVAQHLPGGKNLDGRSNYVFCETHGRGHLMGVTLGVIQTAEGWMGEGDDMIFVDDPDTPIINGTGTEDYFLGSWDFGGRLHAQAFSHRQYGAPLIQSAERVGGRYCLYRFHGDNPVTFDSYLRHTIEHGHANDRADNFYSCAFWYQDRPYTDFPPLPPVQQRQPRV